MACSASAQLSRMINCHAREFSTHGNMLAILSCERTLLRCVQCTALLEPEYELPRPLEARCPPMHPGVCSLILVP